MRLHLIKITGLCLTIMAVILMPLEFSFAIETVNISNTSSSTTENFIDARVVTGGNTGSGAQVAEGEPKAQVIVATEVNGVTTTPIEITAQAGESIDRTIVAASPDGKNTSKTQISIKTGPTRISTFQRKSISIARLDNAVTDADIQLASAPSSPTDDTSVSPNYATRVALFFGSLVEAVARFFTSLFHL